MASLSLIAALYSSSKKATPFIFIFFYLDDEEQVFQWKIKGRLNKFKQKLCRATHRVVQYKCAAFSYYVRRVERWENDIEAGSHHNVLSLSKKKQRPTWSSSFIVARLKAICIFPLCYQSTVVFVVVGIVICLRLARFIWETNDFYSFLLSFFYYLLHKKKASR